ncbi:MAG: hypothetical protein Q9174_000931 [Haloplaca sp. 1 TL-2023]
MAHPSPSSPSSDFSHLLLHDRIRCLPPFSPSLINIAIAFGDYDRKRSIWSASSLAAIVLASVSTATYLVLTLHTFRRIHIVRNRDAMHRPHSDGESYHLLPEDEMQRQQLLRLLLQRENHKKPSPDASQSTFHIDLPDNIRRMETHLTTPRHAHAIREIDSRGRGNTFTLPSFSPLSSMRVSSPYQAVATHDHQTSSSVLQHRQSPPNSQHNHSPPTQPSSQTGHQSVQRNFSESSRAPPYSALSSHGSIRFPTEKERNARYTLDGEIHPLEREREQEADTESTRPQFHVLESSPVQDLGKLMEPGRSERREDSRGDVRRQRSTSRESRRAEIELERGKMSGKMVQGQEDRRVELGVQVSPRIVRVETDGWGKK